VVRPRAVLFDLLTALIDSWSLWESVAGADAGRRWRTAYLRNTYAQQSYRPYEAMVREAAVEEGLPPAWADRLLARYGELSPWPEVGEVLGPLATHLPLAVVTNCSESLGRVAAAQIGVGFATVVTAERAGFYKPHPRPYRLALEELGDPPAAECLFVAGSPYDLFGATAVGLPVFWHDRVGMAPPAGAPAPMARHATLSPLVELVLGRPVQPGAKKP
jgi:2-haloacid dehalogenase